MLGVPDPASEWTDLVGDQGNVLYRSERRFQLWHYTVSHDQLVLKYPDPDRLRVAAVRQRYLVLLLCRSANLGSGMPGGRCGLTASLNQASC